MDVRTLGFLVALGLSVAGGSACKKPDDAAKTEAKPGASSSKKADEKPPEPPGPTGEKFCEWNDKIMAKIFEAPDMADAVSPDDKKKKLAEGHADCMKEQNEAIKKSPALWAKCAACMITLDDKEIQKHETKCDAVCKELDAAMKKP